jgi:hypothetical protein
VTPAGCINQFEEMPKRRLDLGPAATIKNGSLNARGRRRTLESKAAPEGPFASDALVAGACYRSERSQ